MTTVTKYDLMQEALDKIDRALKTVSRLCDGTERWTMSVPAQPDYDPDLVISGALCAARDALRDYAKQAVEAALAAPQPPAQPEQDEPPMYYLQDTRRFVGNCPLWWSLIGSGYTTDLRKAQKYTLSEAMVQHRCRDSDLPWLCTEIDVIQRPTVDQQDMPRGHAAQREIVKATQNTKEN